ncbi:MAG: hypothetical protein NVS2B7_25390 [Herpetosiphon sp.]
MADQVLSNLPRVLVDGQLEVRPNHQVPVLAQPTTHRLIVLNSAVVNQLEVGQELVLHLADGDSQAIVVEGIDRLSMITRYGVAVPPTP